MKNEYWFKAKKYGIGFTPKTKEGWVLTLIFIALLLFSAFMRNLFSSDPEPTTGQIIGYLFDVAILTAAFTLIFKDKIEGGLKWRWGKEI